MDIDEVIQEFEDLAKFWIAESHKEDLGEYWLAKSYELSSRFKQIAEWLKELKEVPKDEPSSSDIYRMGFNDGVKAITDLFIIKEVKYEEQEEQ